MEAITNGRQGWRRIALALLLTLPWLHPFAGGPSSAVQPWLIAIACALVALQLACAPMPPGPALLLLALGAWAALSPGPWSTEKLVPLAFGALILAAACVGRGLHREGGDAELLARAWLLAACISAVFALLQYFGIASLLRPLVNGAEIGEALSNLRQRNQFASLSAIGLAAALWYAGRARVNGIVPGLAVALLACANAATTSRTGLVEWVTLSALVLWWPGEHKRRRVLLCALGLAVYALASLALPAALVQLTGIEASTLFGRLGSDLGCSSRRVLWGNVLTLIAQHPLLGWGWGELDYAHFAHLYGDAPRFCDILDNAHNLPLHLAVELGLPAALLVCAVVAAAVWRARPWREADAGRQLAWSVIAVIAIHSLLEYPLWYGPFQVALGLCLGWLATPAVSQEAPARSRRAPAVVGAALLVLVAYAQWDYLRVSQIYLPPEQRLAPWREDTLAQARRSTLFAGQAAFADLTLASLTPENAQRLHDLAGAMLHYSPEPRVIELAIESATQLGRQDEAVLQLARFRAAFPKDYAAWRRTRGLAPTKQP